MVVRKYYKKKGRSVENARSSAGVRQQLGLTRREQQLIPLIAEGLTNKKIANRFCLS